MHDGTTGWRDICSGLAVFMTMNYEAASQKVCDSRRQTGTSPEHSRAATKQFRPPHHANTALLHLVESRCESVCALCRTLHEVSFTR